jgi:hypothetical protein
MSSFDGIGVGDTVVVISAVDTGPTKRFQRSSTLRVMTEVNAVGLGIDVPLKVVEAGYMVPVAGEPLAVELAPWVWNVGFEAVFASVAEMTVEEL